MPNQGNPCAADYAEKNSIEATSNLTPGGRYDAHRYAPGFQEGSMIRNNSQRKRYYCRDEAANGNRK